MVAARQFEVFLEEDGSGEKGAADVLCFHGLGDSHKFVITLLSRILVIGFTRPKMD